MRPLNLKLQVNVHPQADWLCKNRHMGALKGNYFRLLHSNLGQKRLLRGEKKKGQGTSDLPCFSHLNLPLVWLIMCLNQSVGISRSFMQIKPHLEGAGKALTELLGISCLKEVFFFSQSKRDFLWTRKFPVSLGENQVKSCCFCFLLVTSINLAEVELDDD